MKIAFIDGITPALTMTDDEIKKAIEDADGTMGAPYVSIQQALREIRLSEQ